MNLAVQPRKKADPDAVMASSSTSVARNIQRMNKRMIWIYFLLAIITWSVFGQTIDHNFVEYDDPGYVYQNPDITAGITAHGLAAAFTQTHARNWHPLTTISHMLDCQVFGLNPAGHHLVNVLLHATATLLLFSLLNRMTGATWPSAFVAVLFAIHPLRAESVAWIAERKDVLSGVFFMLTLGAYVEYARDKRPGRYLMVILFFALALMCKPMVVTLPALLLLLDFWPLDRFGIKTPAVRSGNIVTRALALVRAPLLLEKIPLLILALGSAIATLIAQRDTVAYAQSLALTGRITNAVYGCVAYIGHTIWPKNLAVFYPDNSDQTSSIVVILCAFLLFGITLLAIGTRKQRPYLMVGWLWYLISLLPVIGLVQVGLQGRADRYTYLPHVGLFIAVAWLIADVPVLKLRFAQRVLAGVTVATVSLLGWLGYIQTATWRDTETLWQHAVSANDRNDVAHNNLAAILMSHGQIDEAIHHYQAALRVGASVETHMRLSPAIVHNSLGNALALNGDIAGAIGHYRIAAELRPELSDARTNLATMLRRQGELGAAIAEYQKVVAAPPFDSRSQQRLAAMLGEANRIPEAVVHYRRALELSPDSLEALNALAWILATSPDPGVRNPAEALRLAEHANHLTGGDDPMVLRILAAGYASAGRFSEASSAAQRGLFLAGSNDALVRAIELEVERYRSASRR